MALPKIKHKLYEQELTGLKKTIKYRAFTVQEQKILLMAKHESEGVETEKARNTIFLAVEQVLNNTIESNIEASSLCTFDMEELFLRIRSKSVGEIFTVRYAENYNDEEGKPKTHFIDITINLDDVKINIDPEHTNIIKVTDDISIIMRYPTFKMLASCKDSDSLSMACIETVVNGDEMETVDTVSREELKEFYESFETQTSMDIKKFFDTMPKLRHVVEVTLHDGTKKELLFEGLESFFG